MCTAIKYKNNYFGRNLDYEFSYGERITITPRLYPIKFKNIEVLKSHYAIIGMAHIASDYPLYYEAANEMGLAMAGLNFVGNASFYEYDNNKNNVCGFELILYILGLAKNVSEAISLINGLNLVGTPFSNSYPNASLHYLISDKNMSITLEFESDGMHIYNNYINVLTNNPPFLYQVANLNNYLNLTPDEPTNRFSSAIDFKKYSRGMGAIGLPGDLSSESRFVRAAFYTANSKSFDDELSNVNQFFHILDSVSQIRGGCHLGEEKYEITIYSSCINLNEGIYYYKTYNDFSINKVSLFNENLDTFKLISYEMLNKMKINEQN